MKSRAQDTAPALEAQDTGHTGGSKSRARVKLGAMNEAWTAEYRLRQDTATLMRSVLNKVEEEGSPKLVDAWRVNYGCKGNKNK